MGHWGSSEAALSRSCRLCPGRALPTLGWTMVLSSLCFCASTLALPSVVPLEPPGCPSGTQGRAVASFPIPSDPSGHRFQWLSKQRGAVKKGAIPVPLSELAPRGPHSTAGTGAWERGGRPASQGEPGGFRGAPLYTNAQALVPLHFFKGNTSSQAAPGPA